VVPRDEIYGELTLEVGVGRAAAVGGEWDEATATAPAAEDPGADSDEEGVIAGTLRAPWKWEELIVESAVVGGRSRADGRARWRRRLDGLAAEYRCRIEALKREEPESALGKRLERDLRNLTHLRQFALPMVDELASWPDAATWGEWIERFGRLAVRAVKSPDRVLQVLAELRPMSNVGPIVLDEARRVLHDRLSHLDWEPPPRRYGRLFIGTPHQARGRQFRVVFVPGLAERIVPQRPREDPLLLDVERAHLGVGLVQQGDRGAAERLLLKIAIGAATERLYLSYSRLDGSAEGRARVPSFYALDVMRAITGVVPDHHLLARAAAEEAGASLSWPAPADPERAIDDLEHDLAVLRPLLDSRDAAAVKGRAHYLLGLNAALHRSVTSRWLRDKKAWSKHDGLASATPGLRRFLATQRLGARPYSLSALQRFATCPYQFLLSTIHRLEPWTEPAPLVRMDPLTRGSLFHKVQAKLLRTLQAQGVLPITPTNVATCVRTLDHVVADVAAEYAESLMPAIERVWNDEVAELRRDLAIWVKRLADTPDWRPEYFELSFGLNDEGRDPRSLPDPVVLDDRFILRGSVDLIEQHRQLDVLRVTDHKTGRNRSTPDLIVGGGKTLQPLLYSMAIERGLGRPVTAGRLFYCTTAGGFGEREIPINDDTRQQALQVLTIIDRAIEQGFLVAAPEERACTWCDFRGVCGPRERERVARKASDRLADLETLRSMR
jgi:CRISPR/Cas system-associated exonuclease Cas4 (RecB family)